MSENLQYLKRLFGRRGESFDQVRECLLAVFALEPGTNEALENINYWEEKIMRDWKEAAVIADLAAAPITLTNAMVGREYRAEIRFGAMDSLFGEHRCLLDGVPGLNYDPGIRVLSGTPTKAGEFDLIFEFQLERSTTGRVGRKIVKFIVNHDPKSLWKNEPSDRGDPYWQEDEATGAARFGAHLVLAASKRGRSHAHEGKFRDDSFCLEYFENTGWGIIAVSDGAGASKYSRKGSALACDAVVAHYRSLDQEKWTTLDAVVQAYLAEASDINKASLNGILPGFIVDAAFEGQHAIRREAAAKAVEMKDYSCTLIFALCKQFPTHFVVTSFWVGDGGIGVYQESLDEVHVLGEPDSGEYAGQTRFLTMADIFSNGAHLHRVKFKAVDNFTALVLMTDGVTDPKFQTDANLKNPVMWKNLWAEIAGFGAPGPEGEAECDADAGKAALLKWLDFWSPGNHDDRTIAVLYPRLST